MLALPFLPTRHWCQQQTIHAGQPCGLDQGMLDGPQYHRYRYVFQLVLEYQQVPRVDVRHRASMRTPDA
jgi:hypothetical protein